MTGAVISDCGLYRYRLERDPNGIVSEILEPYRDHAAAILARLSGTEIVGPAPDLTENVGPSQKSAAPSGRRDLGPAKYALGSALRDAHRDATTWEDFAERAAVILAPAPSALADAARAVVDEYDATPVAFTGEGFDLAIKALRVALGTEVACPVCEGTGSGYRAEEACQYCSGSGLIEPPSTPLSRGSRRGDGWLPIGEAPYGQEVEVRAGMMQFRAKLVPDASLDASAKSCDQWQATREGEHPPCWSDCACWEVNEDLSPSLQPETWRPLRCLPAQRPVQGGDRHG